MQPADSRFAADFHTGDAAWGADGKDRAARPGAGPPEWRHFPDLSDYAQITTAMADRVDRIGQGKAGDAVWLLEHSPVYTAGTSARPDELLAPRFPVHRSGRGGKYTYHGPGQRVIYTLFDLNRRNRDIRGFVCALEDWGIAALAQLGVPAWRVAGRVGLWTHDQGREAKIGAIGVRVRRWVTSHGMAINVDPDLDHFNGIVPCGLAYPVTSLARLGVFADLAALDQALHASFQNFLNAITPNITNRGQSM